uniref:Uncharacterized protein n=1 Tax=Timema cristinae TaxID=61476 RepID=A0A7R9CDP0_TIMCR|nr:unnamed protein product [Timema cristinae]
MYLASVTSDSQNLGIYLNVDCQKSAVSCQSAPKKPWDYCTFLERTGYTEPHRTGADESSREHRSVRTVNPRWWHRRTSMEKYLTVVAGASLCMLVAICIAFAIVSANQRSSSEGESLPFMPAALEGRNRNGSLFKTVDINSVCLHPTCVHEASAVLSSMDLNVDPCDNFYDFACGQFIKKTTIPDEKSSVNRFTLISDELQMQLRQIVDEPVKDDDLQPFRLAKDLFRSCINKSRIEERGLGPFRELLKELGGWPVLEGDSWKEADFTWLNTVYKFRKAGYSVDYFMDFSLDQGQLGLSREFLIKGLSEKHTKAYHQYQIDVATLFGADKTRVEREMREALDFEIKLANISLPSEMRRNISLLYNPTTVEGLQKDYPSIPWLEYINNILPKDIQVRNDELIIVAVPSYLRALEGILSNTPKRDISSPPVFLNSSTCFRVLSNYAMTRVVLSSVSYLTEELRAKQLKYATALTGKTEREARWKECVDIVAGGGTLTRSSRFVLIPLQRHPMDPDDVELVFRVSLSVGSLYVRRYFHEEAKKSAMEMVQDIRNQFLDILKTIDWMDDETRMKGIDKAKSMSVHIAYPDELLDNSKLEKFYQNLEINPDLYLESILNLTKFGTSYSFGRLRQPVNKSEWITHGRPAVVNAYYSSIENSIQFPAGILQGHFFNSDRPRYMNYGAIGFVIGHEITHGFDDQGRQFDKNGNLVDWWQAVTMKKYLAKTRCVIEQYGNYTDEHTGLKLNGINTQGENIADNGGLKEAYRAYLAWVDRNHVEQTLPGLDYNPRQMFWISAAQTWCSKYRTEAMHQRIITGVHSPGRFRVQGPCSNLEEFSKDFNCPRGSAMNPEKKCKVW